MVCAPANSNRCYVEDHPFAARLKACFRLKLRAASSKSKLALTLFVLLLLAQQPLHAGDGVFVPNFWDPHNHIAKPDISSLHSLRFLTGDDYPPFHFALPDGSLSGFDVDLARAICEELKITCTIQARRYDTLIDALNGDQGDALMAGLRIDQQTRAALDFSGPYYITPARFAALRASLPCPRRRKPCGEKPSVSKQKVRMKPISRRIFRTRSASPMTLKNSFEKRL